jgi:hypothetical protein
MPRRDRWFRSRVPREAQIFIEERGLPMPDTWVEAGERPPYLTDSARAILFGDDLPKDLAPKLGVPVDAGRIALPTLVTRLMKTGTGRAELLRIHPQLVLRPSIDSPGSS